MLEFTRVIKEIDRNDSMLLKITISGPGPAFLSSMVNVSVSVVSVVINMVKVSLGFKSRK